MLNPTLYFIVYLISLREFLTISATLCPFLRYPDICPKGWLKTSLQKGHHWCEANVTPAEQAVVLIFCLHFLSLFFLAGKKINTVGHTQSALFPFVPNEVGILLFTIQINIFLNNLFLIWIFLLCTWYIVGHRKWCIFSYILR